MLFLKEHLFKRMKKNKKNSKEILILKERYLIKQPRPQNIEKNITILSTQMLNLCEKLIGRVTNPINIHLY
jgi:hypothetical protein